MAATIGGVGAGADWQAHSPQDGEDLKRRRIHDCRIGDGVQLTHDEQQVLHVEQQLLHGDVLQVLHGTAPPLAPVAVGTRRVCIGGNGCGAGCVGLLGTVATVFGFCSATGMAAGFVATGEATGIGFTARLGGGVTITVVDLPLRLGAVVLIV